MTTLVGARVLGRWPGPDRRKMGTRVSHSRSSFVKLAIENLSLRCFVLAMVRIDSPTITVCCFFASSILWASDHEPGQFQHHPDVCLELFAQEPDVVDPVSLTFAANGDCYVVEMRDYPYGVGPDKKPGGTVRLLRDRDGDGRVDESKLFASGLSFPTSIMAWRDGVLVVAPPEVVLLRDTDGDDQADQREVVIAGLRRGVTDSNANGLRFGIDNLIHVVNGGNGGDVSTPERSDKEIRLGNSDFAFDPGSGEIVRTCRTGGGFGLVLDDFGHSFTTHNLNYLQQRIIPTRYIEQSPEMFSFPATENISDHGVSAKIYPIVQAVTRVNHPEQAGHFSSSGGMGILQQYPFSPRLANSVFVCDVVCNLVHRDVLREVGPVFRAARAPEEQTSEFIASRDPSFRPVGLEPGPDGAMYLIDMQRDVIEHPDYIPERVRNSLDLRAGSDRGRIYRMLPNDGLPKQKRSLAAASTDELVDALQSSSRWHQVTAHRLLADHSDPQATTMVRDRGSNSDSPIVRARSLWIMEKRFGLAEPMLRNALQDPDPSVRENAILIAERRLQNWPEGVDSIVNATNDPHARVRFQAALTLDDVRHPQKLAALLQMLMSDRQSKWSRRAVLLSIDDEARELLMQMWTDKLFQSLPDDESKFQLLGEVAEVAAATDAGEQAAFVQWLQKIDVEETSSEQMAALLSGLHAAGSVAPCQNCPSQRSSQLRMRG